MTAEDNQVRTPSPSGLTRRGALVAPAVVVGGGLPLAGCGGGGSDSGASAGRVELAVADVPVGGGVVRDGVVVTQPTQGEFHAFDARCPHQGCAVNQVDETAIHCPCHGSTFDPTSGERTAGPAAEGLGAKEVAVDGDTLTVT
ncbi:Rieske (2Fe-2S) protein [Janibacter sp. YIM B02568]|uniref:QcrA and Rieske domain-containing protein n=1 Tax=Janibacter endophyticus TaxID=2806261 RepID=UPI00194F4C7A|nr:Rieske (2Fe-2S) protein [Janibacter endophyticus]MBM6546471.1 Rieske (2Fe-2S) protein [Janibacter endophyticus]